MRITMEKFIDLKKHKHDNNLIRMVWLWIFFLFHKVFIMCFVLIFYNSIIHLKSNCTFPKEDLFQLGFVIICIKRQWWELWNMNISIMSFLKKVWLILWEYICMKYFTVGVHKKILGSLKNTLRILPENRINLVAQTSQVYTKTSG